MALYWATRRVVRSERYLRVNVTLILRRRQYLEVEVRLEPTTNRFSGEGGAKGHVWSSCLCSKRCAMLLLDEKKQEIFLS